jgi:hypothetical protein
MQTGNFSSGLQGALSLFGGNRVALKTGSAYFASNKDYLNHIVNRNILAKAAQLVNDLEDAKAAKGTFQEFLNQKQSELKSSASIFSPSSSSTASSARGTFLDEST